MLKSSGILLYDPQSASIPTPGKWWAILECCSDLGRYYLEMYTFFNRGSSTKLMKPAWGTHISIIRGEEPKYKDLWNLAETVEYEFEYQDKLLQNEEYCWLPIVCPRLLDIREQLGLSREPMFNLHLTIGRKT